MEYTEHIPNFPIQCLQENIFFSLCKELIQFTHSQRVLELKMAILNRVVFIGYKGKIHYIIIPERQCYLDGLVLVMAELFPVRQSPTKSYIPFSTTWLTEPSETNNDIVYKYYGFCSHVLPYINDNKTGELYT